ncbi:soluble scavenger receptor cysteine-rich domain-containing protein SSC5D-like isoform X1 [Ahaetulla prasina]|uniref:soluble scavenger receptor cysteine-rich domain-containing protein SSC5D-like isoform X1 n=1 Tax=Ahaetulla prasina TaxID=499056 RepID=UPI00264903ED|nr:soluble scavenger receptor cysteine-rich domain-containing protein SSC5D-like isoform X1 [Ahaetulla prasina]XP_058038972.1 soluble scavenger receptor cysteine-rich domain-containing protein SSC5D-like isoform X1 [Ahaetulla prasina]XP_058038973.1 soluble scavenger receptor cysteine-rich domain-containing protein SSC5D-like isoform X1 [Ahaetulla prasina]
MQSSLSFLVVFLKLHVTGAFQIRLSGGPNLCVGRVEILHKDEWGTVCDDDWDLRDVAVVCRELNCGEALSAPHGAWFGEGVGSIWLNEVHCAGTERHLLSCHHRGFRKHICTHEEDASAICSEQRFPLFTAIPAHTSFKKGKMEAVTTTRPLVSPTPTEETLRLVGGRNQCSGRLEIFHEGQWGTVCDDMWDLLDVTVICRELDCGEALAAPGGAFFGEGNSVIWLDDVQCQGEESKLADCHTSPWGTNNCRHNEDAGVVCSGAMSLAMIEEHTAMLTKTLAPQRSWSVTPNQIPNPIQIIRKQEETLTSQEPTDDILKGDVSESGQQLLRLVDGPESCAGRVEVLYKGQWGTVCDDGWDLVDAAVVCRELDCGAPLLSPGNARYGPGSGPIWLDDVNCTGREFTIKHCHSKPWGKHNCNHHEDASVICTGKWKRLLFQKPIGSSKATELPISITSEPVSPSNSELQNVMDVAEITTNIQEFPDKSNIKSLNQSYTEDPFLKTPSVKIEQENETKPINPSDIVESTLSPNILQHTQAKNSYKFPKTRLSTRKWKKESISSTENFQPSSITWDTESKREIRSTTPGFVDKTIYNSENPQHVQEMEPAISSKIMSSFQNRREMPISQSIEFKSLSMWDIESDRERPSGAGPPPFAQSFNSAPERLPSTYWDSNAEVSPLTKNIEFNDIFNENQDITTATWIQVPEKVISTSDMRNELFELSNSFEVTKEVELPITTKNLQSEKRIETTTPKVIDYEEKSNHEKQEESNIDPHPVEPSGLTKTSDANVLSAKPVTYSEHCESSPDCLIKQEQSKADQRCCCSPQALRNLVHTMKGLHGELGSVSVAIKNQGSQLEAVAHNLAELSASIRLLVAILPSLVQPGSSQSFLSPSGQVESQLENQLPLK